MVTLVGEEIYGLVVEFGTHSTRVGFIGDDRPRVVIPSAYTLPGKQAGDLNLLAKNCEIVRVIEDGEIKDWEGLEFLWDESVRRRLGLREDEALPPLLLVESPVLLTQAARERLCQVAFERFKVPALFMAKTPVMVCFESGRHTGLVVDIGAGSISVTPVYDGYVLKNAAVIQKGFGGDWLSGQLLETLRTEIPNFDAHEFHAPPEIKKKTAVPLAAPSQYELNPSQAGAKDSFLSFHRQRLLDDAKEQVLQVSESTFNAADLALRPPRYFELPTGYNRNFNLERFRVAECLFSPAKFGVNVPADWVGLVEMVNKCVLQCDADMRGALVNNIIVTGGGSMLSGLQERILTEFSKLSSYGRVKCHFGSNTGERKFGAWIGASILGSLSTFQSMWMTRKEFDEHGPAAIERKFP